MGIFEILQTLSDTFEIIEKLLGIFEILQKFVGIFEIFWKYSVIFEIYKIVLGIFEINEKGWAFLPFISNKIFVRVLCWTWILFPNKYFVRIGVRINLCLRWMQSDWRVIVSSL